MICEFIDTHILSVSFQHSGTIYRPVFVMRFSAADSISPTFKAVRATFAGITGRFFTIWIPEPGGAAPDRLRHVLKLFLVDANGAVRNIYSTGFLDLRLLLNDLETVLASPAS